MSVKVSSASSARARDEGPNAPACEGGESQWVVSVQLMVTSSVAILMKGSTLSQLWRHMYES